MEYNAQIKNNGFKPLYTLDIEKVLKEAISKPFVIENSVERVEKAFFSLQELMELEFKECQYLWEPFFPRVGVIGIVGEPDTGKSQFIKEFCLRIGAGMTEFLGMNIKATHNKALMILSEDSQQPTKYSTGQQLIGLGIDKSKINCDFVFSELLTFAEVKELINEKLKIYKYDVIVFDPYGEFFDYDNLNDNAQVRKSLQYFSKVASQYNLLVVIIHHVKKDKYGQKASKGAEIGAGAFGQKLRAVFNLRYEACDPYTMYFTPTKGNYLSYEYKKQSMVLKFSKETFLFINTGEVKPLDDNNPFSKESKINYDELALQVFETENEFKYTDIVNRIVELTGKSESNAKYQIGNMIESKIIIKTYDGKYKLIIEEEQYE